MGRLRGGQERLTAWLGRVWEGSPGALVSAGAVAAVVFALSVAATLIVSTPTVNGDPEPPESTALSFAVLAGTSVTNTGASVVSGELGVSPGTEITGFPPGKVSNGGRHAADDLAGRAQADLEAAYDEVLGQERPSELPPDLGGSTLLPGLYKQATELSVTGTLTLDGQENPDAVFVFQAGFTLTTAPDSTIVLINGAQACNVFWQVASSAMLGSNSTFAGTILALASVTVQTGTTVSGRVLARLGKVTLETSRVSRPSCDTPPSTGPFNQTPEPEVDSGGASSTPTTTVSDATDPARTGSTTASTSSTAATTVPTNTTTVTTTTETTTEPTTTETTQPTTTDPTGTSSPPTLPADPPDDPPVDPPQVDPPGPV